MRFAMLPGRLREEVSLRGAVTDSSKARCVRGSILVARRTTRLDLGEVESIRLQPNAPLRRQQARFSITLHERIVKRDIRTASSDELRAGDRRKDRARPLFALLGIHHLRRD